MSRAYYNEINPFAAAWLRNLIAGGCIAEGDVDERDIRDITPSDLSGYTQCHFFAGIGVWSSALRLAGWPDDRPVWTGSCPCQPFSAIGRGDGFADERHLWPHWHHLIRECRPAHVFGEQVASKDGLNWLDLVQSDLEGTDYACWSVDLCAAGVGAPHIRQRLWFMGHALGPRLEGFSGNGDRSPRRSFESGPTSEAGKVGGYWSGADWIECSDGKRRPVEPGSFPLAHGIASRVGLLSAYGNAIVREAGAHFIATYLEHEADQLASAHGARGDFAMIGDLL